MAMKHRIPTIFNLSMVDVLCCALGCVILLWLVNLREAKQRSEAASETSSLLAATRSQLDDKEQRLLQADREHSKIGLDLQSAQDQLANLDKAFRELRTLHTDTADRLAKKTREQLDLAKELLASRQKNQALDVLVREKETQARTMSRSVDDLTERLHDADARLKQLGAQADLVPGLRTEIQSLHDKLTSAESQRLTLQKDINQRAQDLAGAGKTLQGLEDTNRRLDREILALKKQLADADRNLSSSQQEKRSLTDQVMRARAAADNRFAGIALTGKRVVFLIDMSGSMELVDENTAAPEKWTEVRQTLARVMRSLPDLEKFQVVLFSTRASYLIGNGDAWLDFDPVTSTGTVAEALAKIKPRGNTDMYAAFEAAFRFRQAGLDTIYVFSDGLPNVGAGLAPELARTLKEIERAEILSKHVRKTLKANWNRPLPGQPRVRINTIGFFYESPDVGAFLWALARENDGSFVGMSKP
jgi:hypothetical protein